MHPLWTSDLRLHAGIVALILTMVATPGRAAVWYVWATALDDMGTGVDSAGRQVENAVWRNRRVQLTLAAGEAVACQLVLEGDESGARQVSARGPELWLEHGASAILPMTLSRPQPGATAYGTRVSLLAATGSARRTGEPQAGELLAALPRRGRLRLRLDVSVPSDQPPGRYHGGLVIDADRQRVLVPVDLEVRRPHSGGAAATQR